MLPVWTDRPGISSIIAAAGVTSRGGPAVVFGAHCARWHTGMPHAGSLPEFISSDLEREEAGHGTSHLTHAAAAYPTGSSQAVKPQGIRGQFLHCRVASHATCTGIRARRAPNVYGRRWLAGWPAGLSIGNGEKRDVHVLLQPKYI